ncbi:MAG: VCBS repeat-containing protein, partial [Xanthomonadales bacterium]|nr:VCBS repeat-containing protein [Xanthomonadales bacterium]
MRMLGWQRWCWLCLGWCICVQAQTTLSQQELRILQSVPVSHLRVADLNGDDRTDLIALRAPSGAPQDGAPAGYVQIRGRNDGPFGSNRVLRAEIPVDLLALDLDLDGDEDILIADEGPTTAIQIWINEGGRQGGQRGSLFRYDRTYAYDLAVGLCALRNIGSGERQDLLLVRTVGREAIFLRVVFGSGGIDRIPRHEEGQRLANPGAAGALCADFNGDGLDDVLIYGSQTELWVRGTSTATPFVQASSGPLLPGVFVSAASARDLDGDGDLDLLLGSASNDQVLENQGPGSDGSPSFAEVDQLDGIGPTKGYLWLDVDGDGDEDLLALRDNVRAGNAVRGTAVFLRQGLAFDAAPVQRLAPAAAGAIAPFSIGTSPQVWLGSSDPGNNGVWATGLPPPPPTVRFSEDVSEHSHAYFMAGTIGGYLDILPQAAEPFSVSMRAEQLNAAQQIVSWTAPVASGQTYLRTTNNTVNVEPSTWNLSLEGITPPDAATIGSPATAQVHVYYSPYANLLTGFCYFACIVLGNCADEAPDAIAGNGPVYMGTAAEVQLVRRLRDERMAASSGGQYYIDLYESLVLDLYGASFVDPHFYEDLWQLKDTWMPAVANLVDGDGQMPISDEMQDRLLSVLLRFQLDGSASLRQAIEVERQALGLNQISGRPISWLQQRWESTPLQIDGFESVGDAP